MASRYSADSSETPRSGVRPANSRASALVGSRRFHRRDRARRGDSSSSQVVRHRDAPYRSSGSTNPALIGVQWGQDLLSHDVYRPGASRRSRHDVVGGTSAARRRRHRRDPIERFRVSLHHDLGLLPRAGRSAREVKPTNPPSTYAQRRRCRGQPRPGDPSNPTPLGDATLAA
jgi:hypothetical protein